jgi:hypothetical protein
VRRQQLRDEHSPETLAEMYATPHDHRRWGDHLIRVDHTIAAGLKLCGPGVDSAADLSCGNGAVLDAMPAATKHYGDLAPGYRYTGPLVETVAQIPDVDLYVCTETIEHLWDPALILKMIAGKTRLLLLSTPIDAWNDGNPEHYWAWDREAVEDMLEAASFKVLDFTSVQPSYHFGIWTCTT